MPSNGTISLDSELQKIDTKDPTPFTVLHNDEGVLVGLYQPHQPDQQQPHNQDEYYFVARGSGAIEVDQVTTNLKPGDAAFVPAFAQHRFVDTSDDFCCWVLFYGERKDSSS